MTAFDMIQWDATGFNLTRLSSGNSFDWFPVALHHVIR